jgi:hypothetical protein
MKIYLFSLLFGVFFLPNEIRKCAPQQLSTTLHYTPIVLHGTLSQCTPNKNTGMTTATLHIKTVLRGDIGKSSALKVSYSSEIGGSVRAVTPFKNGDTKVFFAEQNTDGSYRLNTGRCETFFLNLDAQQNVVLNQNIPVSIADFKAGIALFEQNYGTLMANKVDVQAQAAKDAVIKPYALDNPTQNQTYALLAAQIVGVLAETTKPQPIAPKVKKVKKSKTKKTNK